MKILSDVIEDKMNTMTKKMKEEESRVEKRGTDDHGRQSDG